MALPNSSHELQLDERIAHLFREHQQTIYRGTDRLFAALMFFQWSGGILAANWISPRTWIGTSSHPQQHIWGSVLLGAVITAVAVFFALTRSGQAVTRHVIAVSQMLMTAVLIHQLGGRIETHFYVFGSLAFLAFYRDWKVLVSATAVTALDHLLRGAFWPQSIFGLATSSSWRWLEHVAWLLFADLFLIRSCLLSVEEMHHIAARRAELEATNEIIESEVRKRTAELSASEAKYRRLVEGLKQEYFFFSYDSDGTPAYVSPSIENVLGYSQRDCLNHLADYLSERDRFQENLKRALQGHSGASFEVEVRHVEDETRVVELLTVPVLDDEGRVLSVEGIARDVTQRKRVEERLRRAREAAEAASRAKTAFLENVSHELRTPLNGILGMTELALDTSLTAEQQEYLTTVRTSAGSLLTLLNDVLDFSSIEAGTLTLVPVDCRLRDVIRDTLDALRARAKDQGLELSYDVEPDVPDILAGDAKRLRQLLINLVGNAIKFTPQGEVCVRVEIEARQDPQVDLHFSVTDTGIGIAPQKLDSIFIPFEQADSSSTRHYGGAGLGLAIASKLVQLMGGRIWVQSRVDQGSTFHFTARFHVGETADAPAAEVPRPETQEHDARTREGDRTLQILLAEDNAVNRAYAERTLKKRGHSVVVASNGAEAVASWRQQAFDLVLMDLQMPDVDGYQATAAIRDQEQKTGKHTPIIALTAHADRQQCLEAGMDGYVAKPIRSGTLFAEIERVTSSRTPPAASAAAAETDTAAATGSQLPFDRAELLERVNHDTEFLRELVELYNEDCPPMLAAMREAVRSRDGAAVARAAHTFKGMVGNFCAGGAMQLALDLEIMGKEVNLDDAAAALAALEEEAARLREALDQMLREN